MLLQVCVQGACSLPDLGVYLLCVFWYNCLGMCLSKLGRASLRITVDLDLGGPVAEDRGRDWLSRNG